ncbi:aladin isoform X1 [Vespula maculifrons]|uniref:Aladin isoform X1 n=1 Tax=Vespula maculifrons TaxID=7453 RepID=A0ABD2CPF0_VESMC
MMKILSLNEFLSPMFNQLPTAGVDAYVVRHSDHVEMHDEMHPFYEYLRNYPAVSITSDMLGARECIRTINNGYLFQPIQDSVFKRIISVWREKGFTEALRFAASADSEHVTRVIHWIAVKLTWALDSMEKGIFQREALPTIGSGSIADIVPTRDWNTSIVRCISWHPHCTRLAVATRDDRIRIFSEGISGIPILRHSAQKFVYQLSWSPYAGRVLAAACHIGVLIWTIELGAASNMLSHAVLLKRRNHSPVTSVAWHPQGNILVSCSPNDSNMIVWDVSKEEGVPLKRVGGGGLCFVHWSFCGSRLFSATCRNIFRVWRSGTPTPWYAERWTVPSGRIAAACFGPDLALIFASSDDPVIFSLPLQENIFDTKSSFDEINVAYPLINLAEVTFTSDVNEDSITVGGRIVAMEWDPSGRYLAVLFHKSPLIALILTRISNLGKAVEVKPFCFIQGLSGEVPNCINFYKKYPSTDSIVCLTIAWSSGRIQHFPISNNYVMSDDGWY